MAGRTSPCDVLALAKSGAADQKDGVLRGLRLARSGVARALAAFALLAIIARALVPAGYMVAPAQDGRLLAITLCSGQGPVHALVDLDTGALLDADAAPDQDPDASPSADAPCVFATMAQLAAPEADAAPVAAERSARIARPARAASTAARALAAPPPWATGPPIAA